METIFWVLFYAFLLIGGTAIAIGLDLRKWYNWLIGLYGLIVGLMMGYIWSDIKNGLGAGVVIAFLTLFTGAMTRYHRYRWRGYHEQLDPQKYPRLTRLASFYRRIFRLDKLDK